MFDALISGKLYGAPKQGTSKNGNPYATAKMRAPTGTDGETLFCNIIAFAGNAVQALMALGDGDAVAVAGAVKLGSYQAKDGQTRIGVDVTAHQVLTAYHVSKKRKAIQGDDGGGDAPQQSRTNYRGRAQQPASSRDDPFGDEAFGDLP